DRRTTKTGYAGCSAAAPAQDYSSLRCDRGGGPASCGRICLVGLAVREDHSHPSAPTCDSCYDLHAQPLVAPRLSIVVLPFANLSNDPDQQYFADAITEDLTTDLSQISDMFVIARNSAFTYRNRAVDTRQIGRELGIRFVLEGSVQRSANKVRIT